jgi:hypothetical protein
MTVDTLTIGKKVFDVRIDELNQADLKFYVDNPRVYSVLRSQTETPSQQEIEELMTNMEHVKQLKLSIEENGGLIDPLIVRDGDFVVLEGNSRLAAYRLLCRVDPVRWGKVKCTILPADIDDSAIFTLLGQYHIVGRKDWSPFEQAGYLYRRKQETRYPVEAMAKELGITAGVAQNYIKVYEFMLENNELMPEKWSYWEEYLKNRAVKKYREADKELDKVVVEAVRSGQITQAMEMRKLGEILASQSKTAKKTVERIKKKEITVSDAYDVLQDSGQINDLIKKLEKFRELINAPEFEKTLNESNDEIKGKAGFTIKKIFKRLESIYDKIK